MRSGAEGHTRLFDLRQTHGLFRGTIEVHIEFALLVVGVGDVCVHTRDLFVRTWRPRAEDLETPRPGGQQHGASVLKTRGGSVVSY